MNFLNEIASDFPEAISFAAGRPAGQFFDLQGWLDAIPHFQQHLAGQRGVDVPSAGRLVAQDGRTAGLINELVATQLGNDDAIACEPHQVVVTAGCQEALSLCLQTLCSHPDDVVLVRNPTYIGITGAAHFAGIELIPLPSQPEDWTEILEQTVQELTVRGKRARAFYLIPDFDNPTGTVLTSCDREAILTVCAQHRIMVLEDNAYRMFRYEGEATPAMACLDRAGSVIYLATYSKLLCPGARVGAAVVPQTLFGDAKASQALLAALSERKSFGTVNTSQLNQALVGGVLLREGGGLKHWVQPAAAHYRLNRDILVEALSLRFVGERDSVTVFTGVPAGGFFLGIDLPFVIGQEDVIMLAQQHKVIIMLMSFFALDASQDNRVRLAFSSLSPADIRAGVERLASYVAQRLDWQGRTIARGEPRLRSQAHASAATSLVLGQMP